MSNNGEPLTGWMGVQPIMSVDGMGSNTGEPLTIWMGVQPTMSVDGMGSNTGVPLTPWMGVQLTMSVDDGVKHWSATHQLDGCSADHVS